MDGSTYGIWANGELRKFGCKPRRAAVGSVPGTPAADDWLIPRADWEEFEDDESIFWHQYDQDGYASCNAEAGAGCVLVVRELAGLDRIVVSPADLYRRINDGVDQGSFVADAILELARNGIADVSVFPEQKWNAPVPAGWAANAKQYLALEWLDAPTFNHIASLVQRRFPIDSGIMIGQDNFEPDANGCIPYPPRGRQGGHAMCNALGMKKINGVWHLKTKNSWGAWGKNGWCWIPEPYWNGSFNDAFGLRVVTYSNLNLIRVR